MSMDKAVQVCAGEQPTLSLGKLLGPNVDPAFVAAAERDRGYRDYPSFDLEYQYSEAYTEGYSAAYHDDMDAREEREAERREFPRSAQIDRSHGL
jgi:hypothetical protein